MVESAKPRIVIENIYPIIDEGRFAVKRVIGESFEVWCDIFMDGHDHLKAELLFADKGGKWQSVELQHHGNDRYSASFTLEKLGRYQYTIRAWPDLFGTWASDTKKKLDAGQDISMELTEGKQIIKDLVSKTPAKVKALLADNDSKSLSQTMLSAETLSLVEANAKTPGEVKYEKTLEVIADPKLADFSAWYEMVPRSQGSVAGKGSTFADCEKRLPDIKAMGFDVIYFTPIHPIGHAHRKGKNNSLKAKPGEPGSPYAIGSKDGGHKDVEPELAGIKQFQSFVKAARKKGFEIALDFAVQCSPDHPWIKEHPEWFIFRPDGTIKYAENPPKKYQDIVNVNFQSDDWQALWEELRSVVWFWIEQGVTIFRVDNPHTKPFAFWEWLITTTKEKHPETIFLAEAFTRPKIMYQLAKLGFNQSYSYFTWRNTKAELTEYLTELTTDWPKEYFRPNFFPVTPDIFPPYLHNSGRPGFIIRLALAATLGSNYGMLNGYELIEGEPLPGKEEYLDSEKYEYKTRDWNKPGNIKSFVTKLNSIRRENKALQQFKNLHFHFSSSDQIIFYSKVEGANTVFVAVNLDPFKTHESNIVLSSVKAAETITLDDLLLGHSWQWTGPNQHLRLDPEVNPVAIFRISHE